jgi:hypothetical protein
MTLWFGSHGFYLGRLTQHLPFLKIIKDTILQVFRIPNFNVKPTNYCFLLTLCLFLICSLRQNYYTWFLLWIYRCIIYLRCIVKFMNLEKQKRIITWDGMSMSSTRRQKFWPLRYVHSWYRSECTTNEEGAMPANPPPTPPPPPFFLSRTR